MKHVHHVRIFNLMFDRYKSSGINILITILDFNIFNPGILSGYGI